MWRPTLLPQKDIQTMYKVRKEFPYCSITKVWEVIYFVTDMPLILVRYLNYTRGTFGLLVQFCHCNSDKCYNVGTEETW